MIRCSASLGLRQASSAQSVMKQFNSGCSRSARASTARVTSTGEISLRLMRRRSVGGGEETKIVAHPKATFPTRTEIALPPRMTPISTRSPIRTSSSVCPALGGSHLNGALNHSFH